MKLVLLDFPQEMAKKKKKESSEHGSSSDRLPIPIVVLS